MSRIDRRRAARMGARQGDMTPGDGQGAPEVLRIDFGHNSDPTRYYSSDFITNDRTKCARDLQPFPAAGASLSDFTLNANKFPTETLPKTVGGTPRTLRAVAFVDQPSPFYPAGDYVFTWSPSAVTCNVIGDGTTISSAPGRIVRRVTTPSAVGMQLEIAAQTAGNTITSWQLWMPGTEGAETRFYAPWLELLENTSVFRCMNLALVNDADNSQRTVAGLVSEDCITQCSVDNGMSIEWQVSLCNEANVDLYLSWLIQADDATWTYVLEYARDNLASHLRIIIEPGNELWNSLFPQHVYAWTQATALGINLVGRFAGDTNPATNPSGYQGARFWAAIKYQAYRSAQIFAIAETVFGGKPSEVGDRYRRVLGAFVANATIADVLGDSITDVAVNPLYDGETGDELFDHFAIAPYFGVGMVDLLEGDPGADIDDVMDELEANAADETGAWLAANKVFADLYGVTIIAYEFGLGAHSPNTAANARLVDVRASVRCATAYANAYAAWRAGGGGLICHLGLVFPGGTAGHWGLWNSQLDFTNGGASPSWDAFQTEIAARQALL